MLGGLSFYCLFISIIYICLLTTLLVDLNAALSVYDKVVLSCQPTISVFRALAKAFHSQNQYTGAIKLLGEMQRHFVAPDEVCFGIMALACCKVGDNTTAKLLLDLWMQNKLEFQPSVTHCINLAKSLHEPGKLEELWRIIQRHRIALSPSLCTSFLTACANLGSSGLVLGEQVHTAISETSKDLIMINATMNMYIKCGLPMKAVEVFNRNTRSIKPDNVTYSLLFSAHAKSGSLSGDSILLESQKSKQFTLAVLAAYLDMLAKSGCGDQLAPTFQQFSPFIQFDAKACQYLLNICVGSGAVGLHLGKMVLNDAVWVYSNLIPGTFVCNCNWSRITCTPIHYFYVHTLW